MGYKYEIATRSNGDGTCRVYARVLGYADGTEMSGAGDRVNDPGTVGSTSTESATMPDGTASPGSRTKAPR